MKKILKDSRGFGAVGTVMVLVVAGIIGFAGWYVWKANNKENQTTTATSSTDNITENTEVEGTENWKEEKNDEFGFSYKYPDGEKWKPFLTKTEADSDDYLLGERVADAGVSYDVGLQKIPTYSVVNFKAHVHDSNIDIIDIEYDMDKMEGNDAYKLTSKEKITINGARAVRWEYKAEGYKYSPTIVYYLIATDSFDYSFTAHTGHINEEVDIKDYGEKIIQTFKFSD